VAQLNDGHDVQDPVDAPVAGAGQAVAFLVAGGGVQRRGAVPSGEVCRAGEAVDVADIAAPSKVLPRRRGSVGAGRRGGKP
jgi:hypothetical protein